MAPQIAEYENDEEEPPCLIDSEAQKDKVRQIIKYQKYLYFSSSSSSSLSSAGVSCSSFASSRRSSSLLDLMKEGSTSLGRLFDLEHTSLKTYLNEYSGSPVIKPILLWGSDTDDGGNLYDPWMSIKQANTIVDFTSTAGQTGLASDDSLTKRRPIPQNVHSSITRVNRRLTRKKSFRRLPRFRLWIFSGFRFRLRLRRLRVIICDRKF